MKTKILYITLSIFALVFFSCEKDEPEVEYISTWPVSGEWWVTYKFDYDGTVDDWYGVGYTRLLTFNTASNTGDSIWITDNGNFWQFQVKVPVNMGTKTFAINEGADIVWEDPTTITNGKVIELPDGDSIYMEIEWASDPGTIYICSGRRVKGFGYDTDYQGSYEEDYGK